MEHISIDHELEAFKEHIELNPRTIFSAKFGDGKTTFLKEFKEKYNQEFYCITLYPVSYSIAENADIFEYIKRDILLQLSLEEKLNNIDFETVADTVFNWKNFKEVIGFILSFTPMGSAPFKAISQKAETFYRKYEENKITFEKYNNSFISKKGSIYEEDAYTQLIKEAIQNIQTDLINPHKCILIIEDLDRIDPGHLFRILNVLGAHIDENHDTKNKFGFDYIITVFDYSTTEHIFHHFYGSEANYRGYMNKFMSINPFNYSILDVARKYFYDFLQKKCLISQDDFIKAKDYSLDDKTYNLLEKIDSLSIREIANILYNIDNQIKPIDFQVLTTREKFNTKQPIIYFLAILKRMNIPFSVKRLVEFIKHSQNCFNILNGYLFLKNELIPYYGFIYENKAYEILRRNKENNIEFEFRPCNPYGLASETKNINFAIKNAIEYALKIIV